jgi:HEPN domain-containing protein
LAPPPLLADVAFHCQQAAEKAMKGFLTWHDRPFRRTHSLEEVGAECLSIDQSFQPLVDRSVRLTEYAWRYRYPGSPVGPPLAEAQEAFVLACEVLEAILTRLPPEVRP